MVIPQAIAATESAEIEHDTFMIEDASKGL